MTPLTNRFLKDLIDLADEHNISVHEVITDVVQRNHDKIVKKQQKDTAQQIVSKMRRAI